MEHPEDGIPPGLGYPQFRSAYAKVRRGAPGVEVSAAWNRYKTGGRGTRSPTRSSTRSSVSSKRPSPARRSPERASPARRSPKRASPPRYGAFLTGLPPQVREMIGTHLVPEAVVALTRSGKKGAAIAESAFPEVCLAPVSLKELERVLSDDEQQYRYQLKHGTGSFIRRIRRLGIHDAARHRVLIYALERDTDAYASDLVVTYSASPNSGASIAVRDVYDHDTPLLGRVEADVGAGRFEVDVVTFAAILQNRLSCRSGATRGMPTTTQMEIRTRNLAEVNYGVQTADEYLLSRTEREFAYFLEGRIGVESYMVKADVAWHIDQDIEIESALKERYGYLRKLDEANKEAYLRHLVSAIAYTAWTAPVRGTVKFSEARFKLLVQALNPDAGEESEDAGEEAEERDTATEIALNIVDNLLAALSQIRTRLLESAVH
jgi:hypothetical protein